MYLKHPIIGPLVKEKYDIVYIISDLHLNHDREFIWKNRNDDILDDTIESCDEYTNYCLKQLESLANFHKSNGEKAYLISLGDNCFNDVDVKILTKFSLLQFEAIYSLPGNHCSGLNTVFSHTNDIKFNNLILLSSNIPFRINKNKFLYLSHFPIMDWDHNTYGVLCGHCHGESPVLQEDNDTFGRIFDCGVDNALRLKQRIYFSLDECLEILSKKESYNDVQIHTKRKVEENFIDSSSES